MLFKGLWMRFSNGFRGRVLSPNQNAKVAAKWFIELVLIQTVQAMIMTCRKQGLKSLARIF